MSKTDNLSFVLSKNTQGKMSKCEMNKEQLILNYDPNIFFEQNDPNIFYFMYWVIMETNY